MAALHESGEENIDVSANNSVQDEGEEDLIDRNNITRVRRRNQPSTNRPTRASPQTPNQAQTPHIVATDERMLSFFRHCSIAGAVWFVVSVFALAVMAIFLVYMYNSYSNQKDFIIKNQQEFKCPDCHTCHNELKECKSQNKQERSYSKNQTGELISRTDECSVIKTELSSCETERFYHYIIIFILSFILSSIILIVVWYCCCRCWRAWRYPYAQQVVLYNGHHRLRY